MDEFLAQWIDVLIDFFIETQTQTDLIIGVHEIRNEEVKWTSCGEYTKKIDNHGFKHYLCNPKLESSIREK